MMAAQQDAGPARFDPFFVRANALEAALWLLIAAVLFVFALRQTGPRRKRCVIAMAAFFLFGVSDLVEIRTGAWWRPWPLLALKVCCVATMLWLLVVDWRGRHSRDDPPPASAP